MIYRDDIGNIILVIHLICDDNFILSKRTHLRNARKKHFFKFLRCNITPTKNKHYVLFISHALQLFLTHLKQKVACNLGNRVTQVFPPAIN